MKQHRLLVFILGGMTALILGLALWWYVSIWLSQYPSKLSFKLEGKELSFKLTLDPQDFAVKEKLGSDVVAISSHKLHLSSESAKLIRVLSDKDLQFKSTSVGLNFRLDLENLQGRMALNPVFPEVPWQESLYYPQDSFLILKGDGLVGLLNFPGGEILSEERGQVSLGVFPMNKDIGFAFIKKVGSRERISKKLEELKNATSETPGELRTDAPARGFSESMTDNLKILILSSPESPLVLSFGLLDNILIVGSTQQSFTKIINVFKGKEANMVQNQTFHDLTTNYRYPTLLNLYLDFKGIENFGLDNLLSLTKNYFNLQYTNETREVFKRVLDLDKLVIVKNPQDKLLGEALYD